MLLTFHVLFYAKLYLFLRKSSYLDNFETKKNSDLKVTFNFKGKTQTFSALTDIIFVVK